MQRTRNPLRVQILRGFESHRFRQKTLTAGNHGGFFCLCRVNYHKKSLRYIIKSR